MSNRLHDKVVLITGAAQGLGFACARLAAAEGAAVVLADIQRERGEQAAATLRAEGAQALFLPVDLRSAFYCCKYAVPKMREARAGSIVNMGSICGIQSLPNLVAYGAAKGGLLA